MAKKQDTSQIYKWSAVTLTLLVGGYILLSFSRQALLDKKLADLRRQTPLPLVNPSPSPRPSPKYTTPKGTEDWSVYEHPQQNFTVRYPKDMKVGTPTDTAIGFSKEDSSHAPITFWVGKVDKTLDISSSITTLEDRQKVIDDLFNTKGNFVKRYRESTTHYVQITKKASLTISGYPAVFYTEAFITWSGQEGSSYQTRYLIKAGNSYYTLAESYGLDLATLQQHEQLLGLVARSFTLF